MGVVVKGILMMSHTASVATLVEQARLMQGYGANAIILMDSAGAYTTADVRQRIGALADDLDEDVGFHAHNNLGLAVANSLAAIEAGATIIEVTARGSAPELATRPSSSSPPICTSATSAPGCSSWRHSMPRILPRRPLPNGFPPTTV